jgi:hypothetical protein
MGREGFDLDYEAQKFWVGWVLRYMIMTDAGMAINGAWNGTWSFLFFKPCITTDN